MTAVYSNAVLVAILPHVSEFAAKLDLPIQNSRLVSGKSLGPPQSLIKILSKQGLP